MAKRPEEVSTVEGSDVLRRLMDSRGLSAKRLSDLTEPRDRVSTSSINAYLAADYLPKKSTAINLAVCFGPDDGKKLLNAWGFDAVVESWPDIVMDLYTSDQVSGSFRVVELKGSAGAASSGKGTLTVRPTFPQGQVIQVGTISETESLVPVHSVLIGVETDEEGKEWTVLKYDGQRLSDGQHAAVVGLIRNLQGLMPPPDAED